MSSASVFTDDSRARSNGKATRRLSTLPALPALHQMWTAGNWPQLYTPMRVKSRNRLTSTANSKHPWKMKRSSVGEAGHDHCLEISQVASAFLRDYYDRCDDKKKEGRGQDRVHRLTISRETALNEQVRTNTFFEPPTPSPPKGRLPRHPSLPR